MNSEKVVKIRVRRLHYKVSSQEVVLRKAPPPPNPKLIRNSGWPTAEYNKASSMYVLCVGVLVRSNFGLGVKGATQSIYILGVSLYYANTGIKKGLRKNSRYRVNASSLILPIHGMGIYGYLPCEMCIWDI